MNEGMNRTSVPRSTPAGDSVAAGRKALVALLRHLLQGACIVENTDDGQVWLAGNTRRRHAGEILAQALSLGLAERHADRVAASAAASAFIRRAMAEREEAFLTQHREMETATVEVEGARQPVRINLAESPLGAAARLKDRHGRPFMPQPAIDAGERLLADFTRGQMQPRITSNWEPRLSSRSKGGGAGGKVDITDSALAARTRFSDAMEAIGPELSGVAMDVCCFGKGLELVERERQWPARSAKLMLRTALLVLARYYDPPRPDTRRRTHHWGAEGFRPVL